jgi:hypothetical protein
MFHFVRRTSMKGCRAMLPGRNFFGTKMTAINNSGWVSDASAHLLSRALVQPTRFSQAVCKYSFPSTAMQTPFVRASRCPTSLRSWLSLQSSTNFYHRLHDAASQKKVICCVPVTCQAVASTASLAASDCGKRAVYVAPTTSPVIIACPIQTVTKWISPTCTTWRAIAPRGWHATAALQRVGELKILKSN